MFYSASISCEPILCNKSLHVYIHVYTYTVIPRYPQGIGSRTRRGYQNMQMLKSRSQPSVSMVPRLQIQSTTDYVVLYVFIENNLHISGPVQLKPMLFKGELYISYRFCFSGGL